MRLNTFSGVSLLLTDGSPARELPRRLAAIAVLMAHGGEQGASRERILELLWGEHEPTKARHALNQSLYALRRALGSDAAILGTSQLSLNPELVSSDLADLAAAERRGDDEAAVALYRGAFLDGFFVTGAAEFEQWVSLRRDEYARRIAHLMERLAERAESAGDLTRASALWRQRSAIDPYDATVVRSLMRVLATSGNVAGAIQAGRIYERLVAQELDLPADARITSFIHDLAEGRVPTARGSDPGARPTSIEERSAAAPAASNGAPTTVAVHPEGSGDAVRRAAPPPETPQVLPPATSPLAAAPPVAIEPGLSRRPSRLPRWGGIAALVGAIAVGGLGVRQMLSGPDPERPTRGVAVLPFRVSGVDVSVTFLGEGMVDLLSHALDDGSDTVVVDAGRTLRAWRGAEGVPDESVPADSLLAIARSLGARQAVLGAVVGNPQRLVLNATLHDVESGKTLARAAASGPVDSLPRLTRRIAVQLVAQAAGEGDIIAQQPTLDVPAMRAFVRGRAAQRRGDQRAALNAYAAAIKLDSTFASAALGMAIAADWLEDRPARSRGLVLVATHEGMLSVRERAQLVALAGTRYPRPSPAIEQLAAWERAVALAPDREDVWTELGRRLLHEGAAAGVSKPLERAARAIDRALALNPGYLPARNARIAIMVAMGDTAGLARWRALEQDQKAHPRHDALVDWRIAAGLHDEATLLRLRPAFDTLGDDVLRRIALYGIHDAEQVRDGERAARLRATHFVSGDAHVDALLAEHAYAIAGGRPQEAQRVLNALAAEPTSNGAHLRLAALDGLYADGDIVAAQAAMRELATRLERPLPELPEERSIWLSDLCVVEQWRAWRGEYAGVARAIRLLDSGGETRYTAPVTASAATCSALLETIVAARQRSPRAGELLAHFESLSFAGPTFGDVRHYAPLVLARLRAERGEDSLALVSVRRRMYGRDWPRYLGAALLLESELARRVGDREAARRALQRFLALRQQPEPVAARSVDEARHLLLAVEQDP